MKKLLCTILLAGLASTAVAGPFGLNFGDSYSALAKLGLKKDKDDQWYTTSSVPRPHPDFPTYLLLISPQYGLCKVIAINMNYSTDVYGTQLRRQYDTLEDVLTQKYGNGEKYDSLKAGSIWSEPRDFTMSLVKDERTLTTYWLNLDPASHDGVASIRLKADAQSQNRGMLSINYESKNADACIEAAQAKKNSVL